MRAVLAVVLVCVWAPSAQGNALRDRLAPQLEPCLTWLIDREQGGTSWSATVYNGGSHWHRGEAMSSRSYGLPQAQPGWKMASAGPDWQTNPNTQVRWMRGYVADRYGGACSAVEFWRGHGWY